MTTLLVKNARLLVTMNDAGENIADGAIFVRDNVIAWVGRSDEIPKEMKTADRII